MLAEIIDKWSMIFYGLQGLCPVLVATIKALFSTPLLPFAILGLISLGLKSKTR